MRLERRKPGATIIPLIISSDKTQLTLFRNCSAYPVYLTIGNLPKELRRKTSLHGQILVGYLPVTQFLGIKDDDVRRRAQSNLFHMCLTDILEPLQDVARDGVILTSGDGVQRRCHPLLAVFVGDYPEQVLVTGTKYGLCPKGTLDRSRFGYQDKCKPRDIATAIDALQTPRETDAQAANFVARCQATGVKPIRTFWQDYPDSNIFQAIQPNILHQLYQGVVKHLIAWLRVAYGDKELDQRFQCLPANHQLRLFTKGISGLARVTGSGHQDICRVLLGVIIDAPLRRSRNPHRAACVVRAVRALLDFVYLVQYPEASESTLRDIQKALRAFHANKQVFVDLQARKHFNLPKIHALAHYYDSIRLFGKADNFNTSYSEHLHIDFAKSAYRVSNRKDKYPQMTIWLQRREQIRAHQSYMHWRLHGQPTLNDLPRAPLPRAPKLKRKIAHTPNRSMNFEDADKLYGAEDFEKVLKHFVLKTKLPALLDQHIADITVTYPLPFSSVCAFHRLKFWHTNALEREGEWVQELPDSIVAHPAYRDAQRRKVQGQYSTALIDEYGQGGTHGVTGTSSSLSFDPSHLLYGPHYLLPFDLSLLPFVSIHVADARIQDIVSAKSGSYSRLPKRPGRTRSVTAPTSPLTSPTSNGFPPSPHAAQTSAATCIALTVRCEPASAWCPSFPSTAYAVASPSPPNLDSKFLAAGIAPTYSRSVPSSMSTPSQTGTRIFQLESSVPSQQAVMTKTVHSSGKCHKAIVVASHSR